jgi:outer membrane protein TolC
MNTEKTVHQRVAAAAGGCPCGGARNGLLCGLRRPFSPVVLAAAVGLWLLPASAQTQKPRPPAQATIQTARLPAPVSAGPAVTLSLPDALARAEKNSPQFQAAATAVKLARENQVQASAAMKPSFDYLMQYLNTQGNGISPVGRFVTNDGIHVYRAWLVARQDMPASFFIDAGPHKAAYQEALAQAEEEIARRGLAATVTRDYYALLVAQRAYHTAQESLRSGRHFLEVSQALEEGGEVAHADVIRFELQVSQQERAVEDAQLALDNARLNLAVLVFPKFQSNFQVVDDLDKPPALPTFPEAANMARDHNPEIRSAMAAYHVAGVDVSLAKSAFYPSLSVEFDYGIEANAFALHSDNLTRPGVLQPNLGYFATYSLNLPLWDWGTRLSQLHQARDRQQLARVNLSFAQRQVVSRLYSFYNEAATAWNQLTSLQRSVALAAHNLQLITMQYEAGATAVPQVLDAETSLAQARDNYAAGEARYRNALATLQTLTGSF